MKTIVKLTSFAIVFILHLSNAKAQAFFEDTEGKSSINLPIGGIARINTADKSLKFGYYHNISNSNVVFGLDASGKSHNGIAPLVSSKKLSLEANFNFNLGFKSILTGDSDSSKYDYLNVKFGVGAAKYKLLNVNTTIEQQITSKSFNKINLGLSYNYYLNGNMISTDSTSTIVRTSESEFTVWKGQFKSIDQFSLYLDYVYIPSLLDNRVVFSVYSRSGVNSENNITNVGSGIYFNKEGEPLKIVGGIIYEFRDLLDAEDVGSSLGERGALSLVVGYNF
jgi:hypothetical protein